MRPEILARHSSILLRGHDGKTGTAAAAIIVHAVAGHFAELWRNPVICRAVLQCP